MGAQTKGNTADPLQRQTVNTQREQEQRAYLASQAVNMQREQEQKAQEQYAIDQRSQYEKLIPQDLRNKVSFEDAYADRGPEAAYKKAQEQYAKAQEQYAINQRSQYEKLIPQDLRNKVSFEDAYADRGPAAARKNNNTGPTRSDTSEDFDLDKYNRLKTEIDQQRSINNTGIAFGPGRSNRGNVNLSQLLARTRRR